MIDFLADNKEPQLFRALSSTPEQLADGLELIRSVFRRDTGELINAAEDDDEEETAVKLARIHGAAPCARGYSNRAGDADSGGGPG